jgi:DNA-binding FrmR family transcriptional regulator
VTPPVAEQAGTRRKREAYTILSIASAPSPMTNVTQILARLKRIEGQVRGLQKMLAEGRDCQEFIQQLSAVRRALDRAGLLVVARRLAECTRPEGGTEAAADLSEIQKTIELVLRLV